ncbi:MAG: hypothetical protein IPK26_11505 [Planctomycetes bacterium]|nr:hypothetical protein [Planctomycetota bacterium]
MRLVLLSCALAAPSALAQQYLVIPPNQAMPDGDDQLWVGGTIAERRQMTLIDASLLTGQIGQPITAITWRRNAAPESFVGGTSNVTVHLSHAARSWSDASPTFAVNAGADRTQVFSGTVTLPNSPAIQGNQVAWTADNTLRIQLTTPFFYLGGTLALEITGAPSQTGAAEWWPADAVWESGDGSASHYGQGCGQPRALTADLTSTNLVPGGSVAFHVAGTPMDIAVVAFAVQAGNLDLAPHGFAGCRALLSAPLFSTSLLIGPAPHSQNTGAEGLATVVAQIPTGTAFLGSQFFTQWFSFGPNGLRNSDGMAWTIATQTPSLPMTLITAPVLNNQQPEQGLVFPARGHVLRLESL